MRNYCFLFNSRNCYKLFDEIFFKKSKCNFNDCLKFNVDLDSSEEQKKMCEEVCERHNIINLPTKNVENYFSAAKTLEMTFDYIEKNNLDIDWVIWQSHDSYYTQEDFKDRLTKFTIDEEKKRNIGAVGFNVMDLPNVGDSCLGRGNLVEFIREFPHSGWYVNLPFQYVNSEYFIVESTCYTAIAINRKLYREYIKSDYGFWLWYWADDISWQFLIQNIPSVSIPSIFLVDDRRFKESIGVSMAERGDSKFHGESIRDKSYMNHWKNKYGWWFAGWNTNTNKREDVRKEFNRLFSLGMYRETLCSEMFKWSLYDGPKRLEDVNVNFLEFKKK